MLGRLRRAIRRLGHDAALAAAHTPAAALALAKGGLEAPLADFPDRAELTQKASKALAGAPIACTEIEARSIERLADMGLFEVGSLLRLPGHELGKRFGPGLVEILGKLTGTIPDPRAPEPLRERFHSSMHLLESVSSKPILRLPMRRLAVELEAWLTARQLGARALRWAFKPLAGHSAALPVRFAQPRVRANSLLEISGLALDRIDLPAEVMSLSLVADVVEPIAEAGPTHRDLLGEALGSPQGGAPPMDFVDRVTARLNGESVRVLRQVDDHRPECANRPRARRLAGNNPGAFGRAIGRLVPAAHVAPRISPPRQSRTLPNSERPRTYRNRLVGFPEWVHPLGSKPFGGT